MEDKRVAMVKDVDYFGTYRGAFVPCIGENSDVYYTYKSATVRVSFALFEEIHATTMALHLARQRYYAAVKKLDDVAASQRASSGDDAAGVDGQSRTCPN